MVIRTGIGGWIYPEWRGGAFYPPGLPQKQELHFASRAIGAIEINATFYRLQKPDSFRQWRDSVPDGFVFALKGSRYVTNRRVLAEAGEAVGKFIDQGIAELGDRLGPICWQLATTKQFDADDIAAFLELLPRGFRHAIEVGHDSFDCAEFIDLARSAGVAIVWSEHPERVRIAEQTASFSYLRCQDMHHDCATGYGSDDLERLRLMCEEWGTRGDVFAFMINGAKERAPAAAMALARMLEG